MFAWSVLAFLWILLERRKNLHLLNLQASPQVKIPHSVFLIYGAKNGARESCRNGTPRLILTSLFPPPPFLKRSKFPINWRWLCNLELNSDGGRGRHSDNQNAAFHSFTAAGSQRRFWTFGFGFALTSYKRIVEMWKESHDRIGRWLLSPFALSKIALRKSAVRFRINFDIKNQIQTSLGLCQFMIQ